VETGYPVVPHHAHHAHQSSRSADMLWRARGIDREKETYLGVRENRRSGPLACTGTRCPWSRQRPRQAPHNRRRGRLGDDQKIFEKIVNIITEEFRIAELHYMPRKMRKVGKDVLSRGGGSVEQPSTVANIKVRPHRCLQSTV